MTIAVTAFAAEKTLKGVDGRGEHRRPAGRIVGRVAAGVPDGAVEDHAPLAADAELDRRVDAARVESLDRAPDAGHARRVDAGVTRGDLGADRASRTPRSAGTRHVVMNGQVTGRNRTVAGVGFEADGRRTLDPLALPRRESRRGVVHLERVPADGPGLAPRAVLSFFAGWLTTELALHHLAWQVAPDARSSSARVRSAAWPGWVGLGITLVSWVGLVALLAGRAQRRGGRRAGAPRRASAPTTAPRSCPPSPSASRRGSTGGRSCCRSRCATPRSSACATSSTRAREAPPPSRRLPASRPPGRRPTLLQIHGGAWIVGSKNEQGIPLMLHLAARGWVCVSANYRLSPRATFPDHLVDVKRAIAWIREHGAEYGANPDFLVVTGGSAGGHLAALVALTANDPEYQPGFEARRHVASTAASPSTASTTSPTVTALAPPGAPPPPRAAGDEGAARERARRLRPGLADEPRARRRAAVLRDPRRPRHAGAGRGGAALRAHAARGEREPGRLRRDPGRAARLRDLPLAPQHVRRSTGSSASSPPCTARTSRRAAPPRPRPPRVGPEASLSGPTGRRRGRRSPSRAPPSWSGSRWW